MTLVLQKTAKKLYNKIKKSFLNNIKKKLSNIFIVFHFYNL